MFPFDKANAKFFTRNSFKPFSTEASFFLTNQGRSSTKIVGGPRSGKNVGHRGSPTEKILDSEWPKTAKMALAVLCFFCKIFKYALDFSCLSKQFLRTFFFLQGFFFHKNPES